MIMSDPLLERCLRMFKDMKEGGTWSERKYELEYFNIHRDSGLEFESRIDTLIREIEERL